MSLQDLKVKPFPPVFQGQWTLGNSFHRFKTGQSSSLIAEHICLAAPAKLMLIPTLQVPTVNPVLLLGSGLWEASVIIPRSRATGMGQYSCCHLLEGWPFLFSPLFLASELWTWSSLEKRPTGPLAHSCCSASWSHCTGHVALSGNVVILLIVQRNSWLVGGCCCPL